jgi:hypothetical protein
MNKAEAKTRDNVSARHFAVDKSHFANALLFVGSWNAYCLAKTSDKFVFRREG